MNTRKFISIVLSVSISLASMACGSRAVKEASTASASAPTNASPAAPTANGNNFSVAELDELFAPIALYPDPLLAQVMPASTFVDQIQDASKVLGGKSDDNLIQNQDWDVSVKAVAHYPQVLTMMAEKPDWTTAVGQAYVNQPNDVMTSVQELRGSARSAGTLVTTPQQKVEVESGAIKIVPAQPQVIYVPQYNPEVVYVNQAPSPAPSTGPSTGTVVAASVIAFGAGLAIGAWLNRDYNWNGGGVYYHGWNGGGWVGSSRSYVNVNNNVYVNNSFRNVNVNRNVVNRNINSYRTDVNTRVANNRGVHVNRGASAYNPGNRVNNNPGVDRPGNRVNNDVGTNRPGNRAGNGTARNPNVNHNNAVNRPNTGRVESKPTRNAANRNSAGNTANHNANRSNNARNASKPGNNRSAPKAHSGGGGGRKPSGKR